MKLATLETDQHNNGDAGNLNSQEAAKA